MKRIVNAAIIRVLTHAALIELCTKSQYKDLFLIPLLS